MKEHRRIPGNYKSGTRNFLKDYVKSHSKERLNKGSVCPKSFKTKQGLQNHIHSHMSTKPLHGKFCDAVEDLTRENSKTVPPDKVLGSDLCKFVYWDFRKFACEFCEYRTGTKGQLDKHVVKKHWHSQMASFLNTWGTPDSSTSGILLNSPKVTAM